MKQYAIYVCETCGYESRSCDEMREHEATHFGLTANEMKTYRALRSVARDMGIQVSFTNNEKTRNKFDKAVENLVAFEKEHGIKA